MDFGLLSEASSIKEAFAESLVADDSFLSSTVMTAFCGAEYIGKYYKNRHDFVEKKFDPDLCAHFSDRFDSRKTNKLGVDIVSDSDETKAYVVLGFCVKSNQMYKKGDLIDYKHYDVDFPKLATKGPDTMEGEEYLCVLDTSVESEHLFDAIKFVKCSGLQAYHSGFSGLARYGPIGCYCVSKHVSRDKWASLETCCHGEGNELSQIERAKMLHMVLEKYGKNATEDEKQMLQAIEGNAKELVRHELNHVFYELYEKGMDSQKDFCTNVVVKNYERCKHTPLGDYIEHAEYLRQQALEKLNGKQKKAKFPFFTRKG